MQVGLFSRRPALLKEEREAVEEFNRTACLDLTLHCLSHYEQLFQTVSNVPLDLLFYDTEGSKDAENELTRLMQTVPHCRLVLLCDSERHAVFGYALRAAGYLTTPLDREEFLSLLIGLIREKVQAKEQFLPIRINGVWSQLSMRHITYMESAGHSLVFHLNDGRELKAAAGFRDYQSLLDLNADFFRCHKSYVVNMRHVKDWSLTAFVLKDGGEVNISRPYRQAARTMFATYVTKPQPRPEHEAAPQRGMR